jgi:hypothetical protein
MLNKIEVTGCPLALVIEPVKTPVSKMNEIDLLNNALTEFRFCIARSPFSAGKIPGSAS